MRGLIYAVFCTITLLSFVGLSMLSKLYAWPMWVSILVFVIAVFGFTYLMARLVVRLRESKKQKEPADDAKE